ncbi:MAG: UPF0149 family protein [Gammaproteobacteria bacterium]|nr:UPF0149 family protein [Gammaproteobacteria bacterium]
MHESNYQVLDDLLLGADAECDAAECHGVLTGLACSGAPGGIDKWLVQLTGDLDPADAKVAECRAVIAQAFNNCCTDLESELMSFELMLPDDSESLSVRAAAIGRWCQGFLFGLSLGGLPDLESLPGDVAEIIRDLSEISRASTDEGNDEEEDERAFIEIAEFVRVSVQLVHEELQAPADVSQPAPTLH